ncbi:MAG TPA: DUF58 domain-containing protein [Haliangiales bacterium]|nr:DUF58 domain-containing protein [Haliangiales bacterium]
MERERLFSDEFLKKLEYLYLVSKKVFAGRVRAERRTRKTGAGIEFADHRDYTLGDDVRYIDWNLYGRLDKLLLRLFEEEEDLSIYMLLDCSRSMLIGDPPKLDYAMKVVAALCYVGLANLDRVSIVPFSDVVHERLPPARGKGRIFKVFDFLRGVEPGGLTRLGASLTQFVHQTKRRGMVVVVSDFYDPIGFEEGLNVVRYHKFDPFVIQIFDRKEADPPLHGDLTLLDCETGEPKEVTISASILEDYRREHERYCKELEGFCTARAVPFFRTSTEHPFDDLILRIFRAGGFLK